MSDKRQTNEAAKYARNVRVERGGEGITKRRLGKGRYRATAPAVERVCSKAIAVCSIGVVADTVERSECGVAEA